MYKGDSFTRIASVSGSLWFRGFIEYMRSHRPYAKIQKVYLSIGDREHVIRNSYLRTVLSNTKAAYDILKAQYGIDSVFEVNKGSHHTKPIVRIVKAIRALVAS